MAPDADEGVNLNNNPFKQGGASSGASAALAGMPGADEEAMLDGPNIPIEELISLVRHSKLATIKEALDYMPNKKFDKALVQVGYVPDFGTVYINGYDRLPFHMNKVDDFGNTMLGLACQNGNMKLCKFLISKGANPNHQNKNGQTPAHFAIAYKFFDLSTYLFENGGDDTLENRFGLSPYDGLSAEGGGESSDFPMLEN